MRRREFVQSLAAVATTGLWSGKTAGSPADLVKLDAIDQAALVANGELTAIELIEAAIARIESVNPALNAVVTDTFELALQRAANGSTKGPLWGVPYLLKDLTPYRGVRFTRGSKLFVNAIADTQPAYADDTEAAGLIVLGKTNTPEFGLISTTEPLALGPARNPWNTEHSTGGSSGGTAAAIAARMVPAAQGSDGGGSIRIPASQCGVFGLKPSRGRFPYRPATATNWPISIRNAMSVSVRDTALIMSLTESTGATGLKPVGFVARQEPVRRRIAMSLRSGRGELPDPEVVATVESAGVLLESLGHDVVPIDETPLDQPQAIEHFLIHWASWAVSVVSDVESRSGRAAHETGLLEPWTIGLADYFHSKPADALPRAVEQFRQTEMEVSRFFGDYDAWLTPVTASPAPRIGEQAPTQDFDTLLERVVRFAAYTPIHNVAGTPSMSIPFARTAKDLPIGVQLSSGVGKEALLLQLAYELEDAHPWADDMPAVMA